MHEDEMHLTRSDNVILRGSNVNIALKKLNILHTLSTILNNCMRDVSSEGDVGLPDENPDQCDQLPAAS